MVKILTPEVVNVPVTDSGRPAVDRTPR